MNKKFPVFVMEWNNVKRLLKRDRETEPVVDRNETCSKG